MAGFGNCVDPWSKVSDCYPEVVLPRPWTCSWDVLFHTKHIK